MKTDQILLQSNKLVLLVGSGPMAIEYAKVLRNLNREFVVIGRGEKSAAEFETAVRVKVITGGIVKFLKNTKKIPKTVIVVVSEEQLGTVTVKLLKKGVELILVEKPAGLNFDDVKKVKKVAEKTKSKVYVGYNRRFYASVKKAKEIIANDGGVLSIFFDFSEPDFKIAPLIKAPGVKENWFLQNSTHVIDLAFFLAGVPEKLISFTKGSMLWHSKGAIFCGAGITKNDALFSYHANWNAPGRWGLEIMTKNHKLFLKPLENLQIQELESFEVKDVKVDDNLDTKFKPGIYQEVESFLGNKENLCSIEEQVANLKYYKLILGD